eukprot:940596-Amphidinium_carterae.1
MTQSTGGAISLSINSGFAWLTQVTPPHHIILGRSGRQGAGIANGLRITGQGYRFGGLPWLFSTAAIIEFEVTPGPWLKRACSVLFDRWNFVLFLPSGTARVACA